VVKVLFDAIKNESLASLIAVHHVVMHKYLHGLFLSDQRIDNGGPTLCQTASTAISNDAHIASFASSRVSCHWQLTMNRRISLLPGLNFQPDSEMVSS